MAVRLIHVVVCDICEDEKFEAFSSVQANKSLARTLAADEGWTTKMMGGRQVDIGPECKEKIGA